jgi:hypothetical protein
MPGDWPKELLITVYLKKQMGNKIETPAPGNTNEMREDCIKGWNES